MKRVKIHDRIVNVNYLWIIPHLKLVHDMIYARKKIDILFTNYEVIKPLPRYDYIVHGVVMTCSEDKLLSPLEVLKCKWDFQWVLSQLS